MEKAEVLLINLPVGSTKIKEIRKVTNSFPPLGILYIASHLESKGIKVKVIDFAVSKMTKETLVAALKTITPKFVGISTYNETWQAQKVIAKIIRHTLPSAKIVAGGAFATFCYEDIFNSSVIDYIIRGEGEYAFSDLYERVIFNKGQNINEISGLVYRDDDGNINSNPIERIQDLDALSFPNLDLINLEDYTIGMAITTARGCPGKCIFCSAKAFYSGRIYFRSAENIYNEIIGLNKKYNSNIFYFTDDTFTFHKKRAIELCDKLIKSGIKFNWGCESRADVLNEEAFVIKLAEAGCTKMQVGLESGNNEILKKLKKKVTIEQVETAVKLATKNGIFVQVSYMIGHAFDTSATIKETIEFVKYLENKYGAYGTCSINTPFPGTEQFINAESYGMEIHAKEMDDFKFTNPIISTKEFTREDLKKYFELAENS